MLSERLAEGRRKRARMKILIYTDGKPAAAAALRLGATLAERIEGEINLLTVRAGTPATEEPPPVGVEIPQGQWSELQPGIQVLIEAMENLTNTGLLSHQNSIKISAVRNGYLFLGSTPSGRRVSFYERYGHLVELLNHEIDQHYHDLVVIAPPKRSGLGRFMAGDKARQIAIDLHASILMARGGRRRPTQQRRRRQLAARALRRAGGVRQGGSHLGTRA